jgi:hypothetical protein
VGHTKSSWCRLRAFEGRLKSQVNLFETPHSPNETRSQKSFAAPCERPRRGRRPAAEAGMTFLKQLRGGSSPRAERTRKTRARALAITRFTRKRRPLTYGSGRVCRPRKIKASVPRSNVSVVSRFGERPPNFDIVKSLAPSGVGEEKQALFARLRSSMQMIMDVAAQVVLAPLPLR